MPSADEVESIKANLTPAQINLLNGAPNYTEIQDFIEKANNKMDLFVSTHVLLLVYFSNVLKYN